MSRRVMALTLWFITQNVVSGEHGVKYVWMFGEEVSFFFTSSREVPMFSELTFKHVNSTDDVRDRFNREVRKLERRLNHFPDDGVQLTGVIEARIGKDLKTCTLNLRLPRKTLHAAREGYGIIESLEATFADISKQLDRYIDQLRGEHLWKKGRAQTIRTGAEISSGSEEDDMELVEEGESDWMRSSAS